MADRQSDRSDEFDTARGLNKRKRGQTIATKNEEPAEVII